VVRTRLRLHSFTRVKTGIVVSDTEGFIVLNRGRGSRCTIACSGSVAQEATVVLRLSLRIIGRLTRVSSLSDANGRCDVSSRVVLVACVRGRARLRHREARVCILLRALLRREFCRELLIYWTATERGVIYVTAWAIGCGAELAEQWASLGSVCR